VADWLADEQRIDMSSSLFAATGTVDKMPRRTYEMYIGILQALADMTEAEFDVWSMPTAAQLELPDEGALGFSINLGEPYLSLELSYENHPGELFFGGGAVASAAVVGILAAIAIPAYQDYTIRAQVTEGLNLASQVRASVAESYAARGVLPRDRRAAGLPPSADTTAGQYVEGIDISNGQITVTYGNAAHAKLRGNTLAMTPYRIGRDLGWACGYAAIPRGGETLVPEASRAPTTIEPKYLPSACR
jgi:type IV pilus assembly protein PilA